MESKHVLQFFVNLLMVEYVSSLVFPPSVYFPNSIIKGVMFPECQDRGCPASSVCRKRTYVIEGPDYGCFSDIRGQISARLDEWNRYWNAKNWKALQEFYTPDCLFLPHGSPIRRGRDGFAEFIAGRVAAFNWNIASWKLDQVTALSEDLVSSVDLFEISSSNGGAITFGKENVLWRKVDGVYMILYEALNFDG